jgi:transketolase
MRDVYAETITRMGKNDSRIFVIDDDCQHSMATALFAKELPAHYINPGIMEAQLVGMAAGLSVEGFIPFVNAFGAFAARRAFDQFFLSCAYAGLNVKIIGWDAGVYAESNGGTHMSFEDTGIMRMIPNTTVIDVADTVQFSEVLRLSARHYGNVYIRSGRKNVFDIYKEGTVFELGKGMILKEGADVTIIACGLLVREAIGAHALLKSMGIDARVVDMYTVKPIDRALVIESAKKTGAIVTAENSNYMGGLHAAVAIALSESHPIPVERVAIEDEFGEVGDLNYLQERFGLTKEQIALKAKKAVSRKK